MKRLTILVALLALTAYGAYSRFDQPVRPAPGSQQVIAEYQAMGSPVLGSGRAVLAATNNPSNSAALVVTSGITSPDVPRNIVVTTGGTTADCAAGNVVVSGKNALGGSISENLAITNTQNGSTTGSKAFKSVSSISLPAEQSGHNCTFALANGAKLGLNRCLDIAGDVGHATFNGVKETTAPTVAASATAVESNTVTLNSALNGSAVKFMYFNNYRCLP